MTAKEFLETKGIKKATCYTDAGTYYVNDLAALLEEYATLRQTLVGCSLPLPCAHNFVQKGTYWKSCTHCGTLAPLGQ